MEITEEEIENAVNVKSEAHEKNGDFSLEDDIMVKENNYYIKGSVDSEPLAVSSKISQYCYTPFSDLDLVKWCIQSHPDQLVTVTQIIGWLVKNFASVRISDDLWEKWQKKIQTVLNTYQHRVFSIAESPNFAIVDTCWTIKKRTSSKKMQNSVAEELKWMFKQNTANFIFENLSGIPTKELKEVIMDEVNVVSNTAEEKDVLPCLHLTNIMILSLMHMVKLTPLEMKYWISDNFPQYKKEERLWQQQVQVRLKSSKWFRTLKTEDEYSWCGNLWTLSDFGERFTSILLTKLVIEGGEGVHHYEKLSKFDLTKWRNSYLPTRPNLTIIQLVEMVLEEQPEKYFYVSEIEASILEYFPYFASNEQMEIEIGISLLENSQLFQSNLGQKWKLNKSQLKSSDSQHTLSKNSDPSPPDHCRALGEEAVSRNTPAPPDQCHNLGVEDLTGNDYTLLNQYDVSRNNQTPLDQFCDLDVEGVCKNNPTPPNQYHDEAIKTVSGDDPTPLTQNNNQDIKTVSGGNPIPLNQCQNLGIKSVFESKSTPVNQCHNLGVKAVSENNSTTVNQFHNINVNDVSKTNLGVKNMSCNNHSASGQLPESVKTARNNVVTIQSPKRPLRAVGEMVVLALSKMGSSTFKAIYNWIVESYPFYKTIEDKAWITKVRFHLQNTRLFKMLVEDVIARWKLTEEGKVYANQLVKSFKKLVSTKRGCKKPLANVEDMVVLALSKMGSSTLVAIYNWITTGYPYYKRMENKSWMTKVRIHLNNSKLFEVKRYQGTLPKGRKVICILKWNLTDGGHVYATHFLRFPRGLNSTETSAAEDCELGEIDLQKTENLIEAVLNKDPGVPLSVYTISVSLLGMISGQTTEDFNKIDFDTSISQVLKKSQKFVQVKRSLPRSDKGRQSNNGYPHNGLWLMGEKYASEEYLRAMVPEELKPILAQNPKLLNTFLTRKGLNWDYVDNVTNVIFKKIKPKGTELAKRSVELEGLFKKIKPKGTELAKPSVELEGIITMALIDKKVLVLGELFLWISKRFPYYQYDDSPASKNWQELIKRILNQDNKFQRGHKNGRCCWFFSEAGDLFANQWIEAYKRERGDPRGHTKKRKRDELEVVVVDSDGQVITQFTEKGEAVVGDCGDQVITLKEEAVIVDCGEQVITQKEETMMANCEELVITQKEEAVMVDCGEQVITQKEEAVMVDCGEKVITQNEEAAMVDCGEQVIAQKEEAVVVDCGERVITQKEETVVVDFGKQDITQDFVIEEHSILP